MSYVYYLSHGGPGSGRYPLGSGERPYQKFEGTGKRPSGISGYIEARRAKKAEAKEQKARNEELRKRTEEEQKKRQHDIDKERVLREGTPAEVLTYKGELTNKEWNEAAERLRLERQIQGYAEQDIKTALDNMKKIQSYSNVASALAKDGIEIWNSFASIYNATPEGQKKPLTLVGKGDGGKKK